MKKKSSDKTNDAKRRNHEETTFTIGDTLGEGKGKPEARDVDTAAHEREAAGKKNALGYFKGKDAVKGYENGRLVSPEADDSLRAG